MVDEFEQDRYELIIPRGTTSSSDGSDEELRRVWGPAAPTTRVRFSHNEQFICHFDANPGGRLQFTTSNSFILIYNQSIISNFRNSICTWSSQVWTMHGCLTNFIHLTHIYTSKFETTIDPHHSLYTPLNTEGKSKTKGKSKHQKRYKSNKQSEAVMGDGTWCLDSFSSYAFF